ncbi:hypothetical protein Q427_11515 [Halomonas sp. BC04]|nr:hypothetical protein Q427_11515 [Halomonas sp. BC04]
MKKKLIIKKSSAQPSKFGLEKLLKLEGEIPISRVLGVVL